LILSSWKDHYAARQSTSAGGSGADLKNEFSPSAASAKLISNLAARFAMLGMDKERRDALGLLRDMKPAQFGDDKEARKAWMDQLLLLAEEYRKDNEYLEAGRTFGLVASESENWEGRAETLYKAGLLLYRAGRKDEAVAALEKAKADGNNLFYANLATERLTQIQKK
jgi:tetratricopeptide (TPR) repeat protein